MKKFIPLLAVFLLLYSCKKDEKSSVDQKNDAAKEKRFSFEKTSPDDVIRKAYDSVHQ
ncbi:hypothetical protein HHL23_14945 [Chryseobacterium sp. RP-3-3]|uniref:Uncharacterized protein n=1 Tax=Chryseobacterium antibioticum TaxID=2728847 RepID=A0A7Y0FT39_9FLAO|nr:hypothetical protein [Chryseobacterium antibioticum]NML71084.1 hypothetical protein [Chryseobacterium antibioticum]